MKYGWRLLLVPLWSLCVAGAVVTAFFVFGWYSWTAFAVAALIGVGVGLPAGVWNTKKLRRDDGAWNTAAE